MSRSARAIVGATVLGIGTLIATSAPRAADTRPGASFPGTTRDYICETDEDGTEVCRCLGLDDCNRMAMDRCETFDRAKNCKEGTSGDDLDCWCINIEKTSAPGSGRRSPSSRTIAPLGQGAPAPLRMQMQRRNPAPVQEAPRGSVRTFGIQAAPTGGHAK